MEMQYAVVERLAQDLEKAKDSIDILRYSRRVRKSDITRAEAAIARILKAFPEFAARPEGGAV